MKWLAGSIVFFLPTLIVVANTVLNWDIKAAFWGCVILAAIIPPWLVLKSSVKWRIAFALGLWVLLAIQFCLILVVLLAGFRE